MAKVGQGGVKGKDGPVGGPTEVVRGRHLGLSHYHFSGVCGGKGIWWELATPCGILSSWQNDLLFGASAFLRAPVFLGDFCRPVTRSLCDCSVAHSLCEWIPSRRAKSLHCIAFQLRWQSLGLQAEFACKWPVHEAVSYSLLAVSRHREGEATAGPCGGY
jgi:hypothetical protein